MVKLDPSVQKVGKRGEIGAGEGLATSFNYKKLEAEMTFTPHFHHHTTRFPHS